MRRALTARLPTPMRKPWQQGGFWVNIAAYHGLYVDAVFYAYLNDKNFGGNGGVEIQSEELYDRMDCE